MPKPILVWDLPTRLFHWSLAVSIATAIAIALCVEHDTPQFQYHMLAGILATGLVVLRLIWGFVGSRYARFASFLYGPRALARYLRSALHRNGSRFTGHNPGAAYAIYAMLLLPLVLTVTGTLTASGQELGDIHAAIAWCLVAEIGSHLLGILLHTRMHRENVAFSMVHGLKEPGDTAAPILGSHPLFGGLFVALALGFFGLLLRGHDSKSRQLHLFGAVIALGRSESQYSDSEQSHEHEYEYRHEHD